MGTEPNIVNKLKSYFLKIKQNKFAQDSFWALFGNVVAKGMSLLGVIVVARFLGKEVYGEYGTIRSTLMNIAVFSTFGLGYTATKFIAEYKEKQPYILRRIATISMRISFLVSGLMAILLFFLAEYIANTVLGASHLTTPLRFVAFWIIFSALTTTLVGILSGFNAFKAMSKINTYVGLLTFVSSVVLTYYYGLNGALTALVVTQILNWYLNYREVLKYLPPGMYDIGEQGSLYKKIIHLSTPVALQEGLYALTSWLMLLLLIKLSDYGEVGLYSAAMQWSAIVLFIPGILRNVILTHLSEHNNNVLKHEKILKQTLWINLITTTLPFVVIYLLKDWVVSFYGVSYQDGLDKVLAISLFSTIFMSLSNVYMLAFMSLDKNWYMLIIRLIRDLIIIASTYMLLIKNVFSGAIALVTSNLISQVVFLIIINIIYNQIKMKRE